MHCILSFQFILNFGNSYICREASSNFKVQLLRSDSVKCAQYKPYNMRLLNIYRGAGVEKKLFFAQRPLLSHVEII